MHCSPSEHVHPGPDRPGQSPPAHSSTPHVPVMLGAVLLHPVGIAPMQVCPLGQSTSPKQPLGGGVVHTPETWFTQSAE
jgi:hypothetical protein